MKSFGSEGILFPVYFIMLALAVYLNVFTGSGLDIANIIINIGMCLGVLPVIGVTLPFLSAGGTSTGTLYLGIGVVLSV